MLPLCSRYRFNFRVSFSALTEMELVINSLTFYLAGMGTVSMLLGYCCYVLATEPKIQEELVKEVDAVLNGVRM